MSETLKMLLRPIVAESASAPSLVRGRLRRIPVDAIEVHPLLVALYPRPLSDSWSAVLQSSSARGEDWVEVVRDGDRYILVDGLPLYQAAEQTVPARILSVSPGDIDAVVVARLRRRILETHAASVVVEQFLLLGVVSSPRQRERIAAALSKARRTIDRLQHVVKRGGGWPIRLERLGDPGAVRALTDWIERHRPLLEIHLGDRRIWGPGRRTRRQQR